MVKNQIGQDHRPRFGFHGPRFLKKGEQNASSYPLYVVIIAAAAGLFGNIIVTFLQGQANRKLATQNAEFMQRLEGDKAQANLIFEAIKTGNTETAGEKITVTAKEFKTLEFLTKNAERTTSRDELLDKVWGYQDYPCTRTVDNHMLRLRQKLESDPSHPSHFLTVHGLGYKFVL
jgi:DNA-binding response OmpR family regulator